jgi:hypothetical protein
MGRWLSTNRQQTVPSDHPGPRTGGRHTVEFAVGAARNGSLWVPGPKKVIRCSSRLLILNVGLLLCRKTKLSGRPLMGFLLESLRGVMPLNRNRSIAGSGNDPGENLQPRSETLSSGREGVIMCLLETAVGVGLSHKMSDVWASVGTAVPFSCGSKRGYCLTALSRLGCMHACMHARQHAAQSYRFVSGGSLKG